jgi:hypothetical protein
VEGILREWGDSHIAALIGAVAQGIFDLRLYQVCLPQGGRHYAFMVRNQGRVTRFVVMAMLQAARAKILGLSQDSAFSWGLNRAIFYAAAKRGFRGGSSTPGAPSEGPTKGPAAEVYRLGDDEAFRDPKSKDLVFTIGDQDQTAAEFERAVVARFGTKENFRAAWEEALRTVGNFDRATLESRQRFYGEVYKPRRDDLSDLWTQKYSPPPRSKT